MCTVLSCSSDKYTHLHTHTHACGLCEKKVICHSVCEACVHVCVRLCVRLCIAVKCQNQCVRSTSPQNANYCEFTTIFIHHCWCVYACIHVYMSLFWYFYSEWSKKTERSLLFYFALSYSFFFASNVWQIVYILGFSSVQSFVCLFDFRISFRWNFSICFYRFANIVYCKIGRLNCQIG